MQTAQQILQQYWGHENFRGEQEHIITAVLKDKDVLALLPTGGGKSICYQIPALIKDGICLVITPLIALMKDQVENLNKKNIPALALYSGMSFFDVKTTLINAVNGHYKFLYLSPERLESRLFQDYFPSLHINLVAVDEAHCVSQWGYDFRPPYMRINLLRDELSDVPFIAVTASATPIVQNDIVEKLALKNVEVFKQSFARPNISYAVFKTSNKINKVVDILQKVNGSSIIYCSNRRQTKNVAQLLQLQNINASFYHAGLTQDERTQKQTAWINNNIRVIVCTNAFGMGIDKPDVRNVIHYDVPDCLENYYQEAGRAGRDGNRSFAVLLYNEEDVDKLRTLAALRFPEVDIIKKIYQSIADYLQLESGIGEGNYYDFDLKVFAEKFKYDLQLVIPVLKLLEQEGLIAFNESVFMPSKAIFTASHEQLREFQESHVQYDELIKCLLRSYEGIYDNEVSIAEPIIARLCRINVDEIIKMLHALNNFGIIKYQPKKDTPQLYFITNRAPAQHLIINTQAYLQRKKLFIKRIDTMLAYVTTTTCRSKFIGNYFGDEQIEDCGFCDNCLAKKNTDLTELDFKNIAAKIYLLAEQNINTKVLLSHFKLTKKEKVWKVLSVLQDEKKIKIDEFGVMSR